MLYVSNSSHSTSPLNLELLPLEEGEAALLVPSVEFHSIVNQQEAIARCQMNIRKITIYSRWLDTASITLPLAIMVATTVLGITLFSPITGLASGIISSAPSALISIGCDRARRGLDEEVELLKTELQELEGVAEESAYPLPSYDDLLKEEGNLPPYSIPPLPAYTP